MSAASNETIGESTTCPWCSATVPPAAATCPSCGASLRDAADGDILGVTQIDPAAVSRAARIKPGRIATWLGAEPVAEPKDLGGRIEPPSKEVREEMLRLELAAIDAEIEAKAIAAAANRDLPDLDDPAVEAQLRAAAAAPADAPAAPADAPAAPADAPAAPADAPAAPEDAPPAASSEAPTDDAGETKPA